MKIRNGYVSNSSSSSFCIYGLVMTKNMQKKVIDILKESGKFNEEDYEGMSLSAILENDFGSKPIFPKGLTQLGGYEDGEDATQYIGAEIQEMKLDETKKQFQDRIKKTIDDFFCVKSKCSWIEDTIYG